MRGGLPGASPRYRRRGVSQSRHRPRPVGTLRALPPPLSRPASSWRMQARSAPPPPGPPRPDPRPNRKVALLEPGSQTKICLWEQNTRLRELFSGLEGQGVETDTPTAGRALSAVEPGIPESRDPAPPIPQSGSGAPANSGFPGAGALAPRPSEPFLSDAARAGRGPPGGLRGRCANPPERPREARSVCAAPSAAPAGTPRSGPDERRGPGG